jgi:hypothetical protein
MPYRNWILCQGEECRGGIRRGISAPAGKKKRFIQCDIFCYRTGFLRPPLWSNVLWFLWGTNWIYICYVEESRPPLWSSGQSSWLQIQSSGFDSQLYHIFSEVVGLEWGPLSLVSTIEELLGRKCSGSGLESREYCRRDSSRWPRGTLYPQNLALTSVTSGGRSVGRCSSLADSGHGVLV